MNRKIKYCPYCGKEIPVGKNHNTYCNQNCANAAKKQNSIDAWLRGEENGTRANGQISATVRNYLIEQANYKCEKCGWGEINPLTNKVPLEIHHIDGDYKNNRRENLQVLCPNCHSLTPNFKALNKTDRERTQVRKQVCVDCGAPVSRGALRCKACEAKTRITEKPVTRDELKQLIRIKPFTTIGQELNVSDNTIRKWCQGYNLPSKKRDINAYTNEEWELI